MLPALQSIEFNWDSANLDKNWQKHQVIWYECEQLFFNDPFILAEDTKHSVAEQRYHGLGRTDDQRLLFIVFTLRGDRIRVISARPMNTKEKTIYQHYYEKTPKNNS